MSKVVTSSVYADSHAGAIPAPLFDMPTMQPQHPMTAAVKCEIMRGYQEILCDTCFRPFSFKSHPESASRGSNPPWAANTILRKSFVKSLNEPDVAFVVVPG